MNEGREGFAGWLAFEGPIGVGKTTLANRCAEAFEVTPLLESFQSNPFLQTFYAEPKAQALATQLTFLFQRVEAAKHLQQPDLFSRNAVSDYAFEKDALFAKLTLSQFENAIYEKVAEAVMTQWPTPDRMVVLQAPPEVLYQRIQKRGRQFETPLTLDYLQTVCDAYAAWAHHYDDAPVLLVNAAEANFEEDDAAFERLLDEVIDLEAGRRFFNPLVI